jgi:hypothetical protein
MVRVFENRMPRRILEQKGGGMVISWRKLHKDQFHNFYSSSGIYTYFFFFTGCTALLGPGL